MQQAKEEERRRIMMLSLDGGLLHVHVKFGEITRFVLCTIAHCTGPDLEVSHSALRPSECLMGVTKLR